MSDDPVFDLRLTQTEVRVLLRLADTGASHEADCYWPENKEFCRMAGELAGRVRGQTEKPRCLRCEAILDVQDGRYVCPSGCTPGSIVPDWAPPIGT